MNLQVDIFYYAFAFSVVLFSSFLARKIKSSFDEKTDEYDLIRKYLLNDDSLQGNKKPKIWIHSIYDVNSRIWKSFQSRNSTNLNQHYLHLTIKSIINFCGDDFNVCLIDDDSFSKLIPSWEIDIKTAAEPMRSKLREIALLELIYLYGGMVVPNSFLCLKSLKELYDQLPFICERVSRHIKQGDYVPDTYFIGAKKNDEIIAKIILLLKEKVTRPFLTEEDNLLGITNSYCNILVQSQKINLVKGEYIGIKTNKSKIVSVDELTGDDFIDFNDKMYGIYLPIDDFLNRNKYNWFPIMSIDELLKSSMIISKYFKMSIMSSVKNEPKITMNKSI